MLLLVAVLCFPIFVTGMRQLLYSGFTTLLIITQQNTTAERSFGVFGICAFGSLVLLGIIMVIFRRTDALSGK